MEVHRNVPLPQSVPLGKEQKKKKQQHDEANLCQEVIEATTCNGGGRDVGKGKVHVETRNAHKTKHCIPQSDHHSPHVSWCLGHYKL